MQAIVFYCLNEPGIFSVLVTGVKDVKALQIQLQTLGYYSGVIDGNYGVYTRNAVYLLQREQGLSVDGSVSNETRKQLQIKSNLLETTQNLTSQNSTPSSNKSFL
ncbi:MAG: peptidoglycan-binding protein [Richelia sp.]|nr:peptidoglycan-binding protein [Richelia sp.]CDN13702.1 hypothetical protein RintRC_4374 [Richelia intracellularis]